ncbi:TIGR01244 family phosphatase [Trinickia dabaoshanensis]|uniref:TIGR01244 family phosphatase n=1 Tax=Trinickia dabaoshanensis TaxID=564714 RepID=A0A2N7VB26_9BURK|nr:TIGR01244 family sulfur transferase [Trinickia dabaoshanensis]PMS14360.1 TIGR01244 family phosphatase [Trinickia dabaoshanensis]
MNPKELVPNLSISPQLSIADIAEAKARGFLSVIVNRPDAEEPGQPTIAEMREAARTAGLGFAAIPIVPGKATVEDAAKFSSALGALDGPVIAYCRTGVRAATLWALSAGASIEPDELLQRIAAAGYDLSGLRPRLEALYGSDQPSGKPDAGKHR